MKDSTTESSTLKLEQLIGEVKANRNVEQSIQQISSIVKKQGIGSNNSIRLEVYKLLLGISDEDINEVFVPLQDGVADPSDVLRINRDTQASFRLFEIFIDSDPLLMQDALQVDIDKSVSHQVNNIFEIVRVEDPQVGQIFSITHFLAFCVGWVLSWWAVNIRNSVHVMRIYDYLISTGPEGVVILGAAFILGTKEIMKEHIQECFDGGEIGVLFGIYQNIWQVNYDLDHIFEIAFSLEEKGKFTNKMRSLYSPESTMHENVITELIPIRSHLKKKKRIQYPFLILAVISLSILLLSLLPTYFSE